MILYGYLSSIDGIYQFVRIEAGILNHNYVGNEEPDSGVNYIYR